MKWEEKIKLHPLKDKEIPFLDPEYLQAVRRSEDFHHHHKANSLKDFYKGEKDEDEKPDSDWLVENVPGLELLE